MDNIFRMNEREGRVGEIGREGENFPERHHIVLEASLLPGVRFGLCASSNVAFSSTRTCLPYTA